MRVACPECSAEYELPPAVVARLGAGGRAVRCARCGTSWTPDPPSEPAPEGSDRFVESAPMLAASVQPTPVQPAAVQPASGAVPSVPAPPPAESAPRTARVEEASRRRDDFAPPALQPGERPARPAGAGLAWAASLLLLAAAAAAAWHWRVEVVAAWPPAARIFQALGLAG
jgi:predicted Zn finger-like uncharacterized protein